MVTQRICIIGSGNVATHLAIALTKAGHCVVQVVSRQFSNAQHLATRVDAQALTDVARIDPFVDVILLSVPDEAIEHIASQLPMTQALVAHTAGSVLMDVLSRFDNYGVFYPFQTFSKQKHVEMLQVPFLLEANSAANLQKLEIVARCLSSRVMKADSMQRMQLHISAVMVCNFTNHLYAMAYKLLSHNNLPFELLYPLMEETTQKAKTMPPHLAQTGPAVRGDWAVVEKHMAMLAGFPGIQAIYGMMSQSIGNDHGIKRDEI
ncbi:MAG: DUF2520 domain-containing protein [Breznakibacter sp.]